MSSYPKRISTFVVDALTRKLKCRLPIIVSAILMCPHFYLNTACTSAIVEEPGQPDCSLYLYNDTDKDIYIMRAEFWYLDDYQAIVDDELRLVPHDEWRKDICSGMDYLACLSPGEVIYISELSENLNVPATVSMVLTGYLEYSAGTKCHKPFDFSQGDEEPMHCAKWTCDQSCRCQIERIWNCDWFSLDE